MIALVIGGMHNTFTIILFSLFAREYYFFLVDVAKLVPQPLINNWPTSAAFLIVSHAINAEKEILLMAFIHVP
jgi:hypothetical protein